MTREECEKMLQQCLDMAIGIYHQYNPEGKNLYMNFIDGNRTVFNLYRPMAGNSVAPDVDHPINWYRWNEDDY